MAVRPSHKRRRDTRRPIRFETLQSRELLAIDIVFDYSYDSGNFFDTDEKKATLELAAKAFEDRIEDTLDAIPAPTGINTWDAGFTNPGTGGSVSITDLEVPANQVTIYLGGRDLGGSTLGQASTSWSAYGTSSWLSTIRYRGETGTPEYASWGGSIAFDSDTTWHYGATTDGLDSSDRDLYSVAIHEIGHILGISSCSSCSWTTLKDASGDFIGAEAVALYGGPVPAHGGHFEEGVTYDGNEVALDPNLTVGTRKPLTELDWAAIDDIGWDVNDPSITNPSFDAGELVVQILDEDGNPVEGLDVSFEGPDVGGSNDSLSFTSDANGFAGDYVYGGAWSVEVFEITNTINVDGLVSYEDIQLSRLGVTEGDWTLASADTTTFEIGGTNVGENADLEWTADNITLDGTLEVNLIDSFVPSVGDSFEIISAGGTVSGTFATTNLPSLSGASWEITYGSDSVTLSIVEAAAPTVTTEIQLDRDLGLSAAATYYENWAGWGEKWLSSASGDWFLLSSDGKLYEWAVSASDLTDNTFVHDLGSTAAYDDPTTLHEAFDNVLASYANAETLVPVSSAKSFDDELALSLHSSGLSEDWGGWGEKWIVDSSGNWHFITPKGDLYQWSGSTMTSSTWLGRLDTSYFDNPHQLFHASLVDSAITALDNTYNLSSGSSDYLNWGGLNEKWVQGSGSSWYYILPTGELYLWHGGLMTNRTLISKLHSAFYDYPDLLTQAS